MEVTEEMLSIAVKKAVEIGLIPKYAGTEDYIKYWEMIKKVLEVALY
jgi:hypothetical protein